MSRLVVKRLDSIDALRATASAWDELWCRAAYTLPTAQAEFVASWCECFAPSQRFAALVVEQDSRFVAAIPLVGGLKWGCRVATLPDNSWSPAGDLLLAEDCDQMAVCQALVAALRECGWALGWFETLPVGALHWRSLLAGLAQQGQQAACAPRFMIPIARIDGDWEGYWSSRSRNHRRELTKTLGQASRQAPTRLVRYEELSPERVEPLLRACFEIEAAGWKGRQGTAALSVSGMWEFYLHQARLLAESNQLSINVLEHGGSPIAFEYGWRVRGVYSAVKVGYLEDFARHSPGQLLRYFLIKQMHAEKQISCIDFLGPMTPALSSWATHAYPVDRLLVSLGGPGSRSVVRAARSAAAFLRRLRRARPETCRLPLSHPGVGEKSQKLLAMAEMP